MSMKSLWKPSFFRGTERTSGDQLICPATERCYVELAQHLCAGPTCPVLQGTLGSASAIPRMIGRSFGNMMIHIIIYHHILYIYIHHKYIITYHIFGDMVYHLGYIYIFIYNILYHHHIPYMYNHVPKWRFSKSWGYPGSSKSRMTIWVSIKKMALWIPRLKKPLHYIYIYI